MLDIDPTEEKEIFVLTSEDGDKSYHFERLITRIDETKFTENIAVDQKHDFTARRFGAICCDESLDEDDDDVELLIKDDVDVGEDDFLFIDGGSLVKQCEERLIDRFS